MSHQPVQTFRSSTYSGESSGPGVRLLKLVAFPIRK